MVQQICHFKKQPISCMYWNRLLEDINAGPMILNGEHIFSSIIVPMLQMLTLISIVLSFKSVALSIYIVLYG